MNRRAKNRNIAMAGRFSQHRGLTLFEVVIAMAIFAGAITALSQALSTATRAALQARLQSQAVLLCQTKMAEVVGGAISSSGSGESSFNEPGLDGWTYRVNMTAGAHTGINQVEVTVQCRQAEQAVDASFTMIRLVRDQQAFVSSAIQAAKQKALQSGLTQQQSQASQ
jgi:general secretion pathway protein I